MLVTALALNTDLHTQGGVTHDFFYESPGPMSVERAADFAANNRLEVEAPRPSDPEIEMQPEADRTEPLPPIRWRPRLPTPSSRKAWCTSWGKRRRARRPRLTRALWRRHPWGCGR